MAREIKFRAWVPDGKVMIQHREVVERAHRKFRDSFNASDIVMQFTGLFDKNGKEIYEGDVVKCNDLLCDVYWDYAGFRIRPLPNAVISINTNRDIEVIGNIYENPELLTN